MLGKHVLSLLVEDTPGLLTRVSSLFSRRNFNIDSLAVGVTDLRGYSRITVVLAVEFAQLEQIIKQLNKLVNVVKIVEMEPVASIFREHMLIKVRADYSSRPQIIDIVQTFRGRIVDISSDTAVVEITGASAKVSALIEVLHPYGIIEVVQSGLLAMGRGSRALYSKGR